jgi:dienelactone hydrolase
MKKIFIILICLLIANPAFAGFRSPLKELSEKKLKNGELIKIQSYNAEDYLVIKEGRYKDRPVKVDALITYPKGEGPFPVLIIVHSSGGPGEFNNKWYRYYRSQQKPLLKMGIAVMYLDNFSGRNVINTYANQQQATHWSTYIDAFMALEHLSKDPKINIKKVGISGYSRGGIISLMISEKRLRDALVSKDLYFAAAQPRSPDCWSIGMFRNPQPIKETKTWMVLGGKDDYTRAEPCVEMGEKIKANGGDIEVTVKKGWHHSFLGNWNPWPEERAQYFWKCPPYYTEDDGSWNKEQMDLMLKHGEIKSEEEFHKLYKENRQLFLVKNWDAYYAEKCIGTGVTEGGNKWSHFKKKYLKFWKDNLL